MGTDLVFSRAVLPGRTKTCSPLLFPVFRLLNLGFLAMLTSMPIHGMKNTNCQLKSILEVIVL